MAPLILASSSLYRKSLLERLRLPFDTASPEIDERPIKDESPRATALRLAELKARAIARIHPTAWVIGSDQVAELNGVALGKPGSRDKAIDQLQACSGKRVIFHTGLALANPVTNRIVSLVEPYSVVFRELSVGQIKRYVDIDKPFDCAGSLKAESLGIALLSAMEGNDPNALIGLPMIQLVTLLTQAGFEAP